MAELVKERAKNENRSFWKKKKKDRIYVKTVWGARMAGKSTEAEGMSFPSQSCGRDKASIYTATVSAKPERPVIYSYIA